MLKLLLAFVPYPGCNIFSSLRVSRQFDAVCMQCYPFWQSLSITLFRSCSYQIAKCRKAMPCYLNGTLGADAVADRMRFHASKEEGIVDVDLKLLPKLEKSEAESRPGFV